MTHSKPNSPDDYMRACEIIGNDLIDQSITTVNYKGRGKVEIITIVVSDEIMLELKANPFIAEVVGDAAVHGGTGGRVKDFHFLTEAGFKEMADSGTISGLDALKPAKSSKCRKRRSR